MIPYVFIAVGLTASIERKSGIPTSACQFAGFEFVVYLLHD